MPFNFLLASDSGLPVRVDRGLGPHRLLRGGVAVACGLDFGRAPFGYESVCQGLYPPWDVQGTMVVPMLRFISFHVVTCNFSIYIATLE